MSEVRRLALAESFEPFAAELSEAKARALHGSRLVNVVRAGAGTAVLQPSGRVGAVRIGDLQVEVWPKEKVKLAHLIFMLGYAADPGFRPEEVNAEGYDELWPALAESLARVCDRALRAGVLQGYRTVEESSIVVRGRIRVADQLRRQPGQISRTEIAYDEYMTDIVENRILRTALRRMRAVPRLRSGVASQLSHLDNRLDGVAVLRHGEPLPSWRPTRLNARYVPALRLAELVLRNTSAQAGDDGVEIAAFVVSMWKVFEDFVTVALREAITERGRRAVAQKRWHFDEPRTDGVSRVPMAIDLLEYDGALPVMVYDAKYKAASPDGRYPNADFYQMLAYCTTTGLDRAVLVYAQGGQPVDRRVLNSPVTIREWPLDLSLSPSEMLDSIRSAIARAHAAID
ncbi:McrC family protein [Microbacterium sp. B2969]|uniref:McrC family protein n=1 Tax=Microbacterium alkaliflavum TaxID=3248839 RepID=A0ABW7Q535_9MICO